MSLDYSCYGCGQEGHVKVKCPFRKNEKWELQNKGKESICCYKCGREGHISTNCEEKLNKMKTESGIKEPGSRAGRKSSGTEANSVRKIGRTLYARMKINGTWMECVIDTGSEVNLLPAKLSEGLEIQPSERILRAANGTCMEVLGELELEVMVAGWRLNTIFLVSDQIDEVLIGVNWLQVNGCPISFLENTMSVQGRRISFFKKDIERRTYRYCVRIKSQPYRRKLECQ